MALYDNELEGLINVAIQDGVLTEKEKQILFKRATSKGIDLDEFEMVLDARIADVKKEQQNKLLEERKKRATDPNSYSSAQFSKKMERCWGIKNKIEAIKEFPVPSDKDDLLDFVATIKSKLQADPKDNDGKKEKEALKNKYYECVAKASELYSDDPSFGKFFKDCEEQKVKDKEEKQKENRQLINGIIIYFAVMIGLLILCGLFMSR